VKRRLALCMAAGALLLAAPLALPAQRRALRIGVLAIEPLTDQQPEWKAFVDELAQRGFLSGHNIEFVYRNAGSDTSRMQQMAAELAALKVDLIYAVHGSSSALAAKKATTTIPIVFFASGDPVGNGLVASLARPGRNITGNASLILDVVSKSLQILFEVVGQVGTVAHIQPQGYRRLPQFGPLSAALETAARQLGSQVRFVDVDTFEEFEPVLSQLARQQAGAAVIGGGAPYLNDMDRIASLFIKHRLPTLINWPEFVRAGLLISYSISQPDLARKAADYVAKILSGAKPADLPVQQPTRFELVINLRTAKSLGLTIPQSLLLSADEVIQ
jgi:putative ABC transport system substrate-binding protein